ncbi:MAG TPA: hypothetical protein VJ724_01535 [Tahibacter sp.]|nr:hypothetical protein [Tahibacter sp.]
MRGVREAPTVERRDFFARAGRVAFVAAPRAAADFRGEDDFRATRGFARVRFVVTLFVTRFVAPFFALFLALFFAGAFFAAALRTVFAVLRDAGAVEARVRGRVVFRLLFLLRLLGLIALSPFRRTIFSRLRRCNSKLRLY